MSATALRGWLLMACAAVLATTGCRNVPGRPGPNSAVPRPEDVTDFKTLYSENCAACHGVPGEDVAYAQWMYPRAPQLFKKHAHGNVVGVSDDDPGETYWKVKNGIRLTGMPAFQHVLSDEDMWDVTLLLKNADQPMSAAVTGELTKK